LFRNDISSLDVVSLVGHGLSSTVESLGVGRSPEFSNSVDEVDVLVELIRDDDGAKVTSLLLSRGSVLEIEHLGLEESLNNTDGSLSLDVIASRSINLLGSVESQPLCRSAEGRVNKGKKGKESKTNSSN